MATDVVAAIAVKRPEGGLRPIRKPIIFGVAAALLLLAVYAGIIVLAQGWAHTVDQTLKLWYWVVLLAAGFGIQAGLFAFIRQELRRRQRTATASFAASGGVSAGAMVACCAHHLTEVLAVLGISGVAAFLVSYQVAFIVVGVVSNAVGISIMLETIQRHNLCPIVGALRMDFGRVKRWVLVSSGVIVVATFLGTFLAQRA